MDTNGIDAKGFPGNVQASPSGERIRYFSQTPFAGGDAPAGGLPTYISSRVGPGEWITEDVIPQGAEYATALGFSEDLSEAVVAAWGKHGIALTQGAPSSGNDYYVRETASGGYRLLVGGLHEMFIPVFVVAGFSGDGSQLVFESEEDLLPGQAQAGVVNAYELDLAKPETEQLRLVGVLPAGEEGGLAPAGGSVAGAGAGARPWRSFPGHEKGFVYTQSAVSGDGSRVVFTALPSERVYVRENAGEPASPVNGKGECAVAADACTVAVSVGAAHFREMTPDGGFVFYSEGEDLYRFDVEDGERVLLSEPLGAGAAGVEGVLGGSADGSAVYFAATGVLAANENEHHEKAAESEGETNLYEWHALAGGGSRVTFIAPLANFEPDERDWSDVLGGAATVEQKRSRVTADGDTLLFSSILSPTGRNNAGECAFGVCSELFRYRAGVEGAAGSLVCVSCDPSGAAPVGEAQIDGEGEGGSPSFETALTRNLSEDGDRVFFQTPDALLASDTNKQTDVYEWEADGEGSCHSEAENRGCLFLISTGNSSEESYFADASADGGSVFFFTREDLTHGDSDENVHLYSACVDCGKPCDLAVEECQPPVPCEGEGCLGPVGAPPSTPTAASTTLNGTPPLLIEEVKKVKTRTNAEKLAKALRECRAKRNKHKRTVCERVARKRYPVKAKKSARRVK